MSKHTPGPWSLSYDDRPNMEWNIHVVVQDQPHLAVCFMTSDGPSEANAKLIAAAPALLALAREYAGECAECGGAGEIVKNRGSGDPTDDYSVECPDCRDIHAVIDVATGR